MNLRNIKLTIEYDGTNYNGWQSQDARKAKSIQQVIEKALKSFLHEKIKLIASGRTDSGAHALGQVANFKTRSRLKTLQIKKALNANLPDDIVVRYAEEVDLKFHSRFDVKSKVYRYVILNRSERPAINRDSSLFYPYKIDLNLICKEARLLVGKHDFKAFQAADKIERGSIRTIKSLKVNKAGDFINIDIEANGFLYKMVRNIVGTLLEIGRGRFPKGRIKKMFREKDRRLCGPTASAKGLFLMRVDY